MMGNQLFQDILSYSLPLIGCPESSSDEDIHVATGVSRTFISSVFWAQGVESFLLCRPFCRKVHEEAVWHKQRPDGGRPEGRPPRQQSEREQAPR